MGKVFGEPLNIIHVSVHQNHMATTFWFTLSCASERRGHAERVLREAHQLVSQLESELTEFREDSPVYRLNHSLRGHRVPFTASGMELLKRADELRKMTQSSFDPLVKSQCEDPQIYWDEDSRMVWKDQDATWLSFGAIGKGYALDRVRLLLEQEGFEDFVLNAGGSSIIFSGFSNQGIPWEWGWSWEYDREGDPLGIPFSHETGKPIALGISGTHEKGTHLKTKKDGFLSRETPRSSLIAASSATDADALSTALFISGWDQGMGDLEKIPQLFGAALIDPEGTPWWNSLFESLWGKPIFQAVGLLLLGLANANAQEGEVAVDLGALGLDDFTPYLIERDSYWVLLPLFAVFLVLIHLFDLTPKMRWGMDQRSLVVRIRERWGKK